MIRRYYDLTSRQTTQDRARRGSSLTVEIARKSGEPCEITSVVSGNHRHTSRTALPISLAMITPLLNAWTQPCRRRAENSGTGRQQLEFSPRAGRSTMRPGSAAGTFMLRPHCVHDPKVVEGSIMSRFSRNNAAAALLASLGVLAAGSAVAQAKSSFESLDKNGDGKISLTEASSDDALFVAFKSLDANKDGELTREEFAKHK
jgi:hypothetical protein